MFSKTGILATKKAMQNQRFGLLAAFLIALFPLFLNGQDTLRLVFSGDIMGHQAQIRAAKTGRKGHDYAPCFQFMRPILESADLAIGNLEVTLPGRRPYSGHIPLPVFRSPDALADGLKTAGFDVLMTANNHSNDSGRRGLRQTIRTLRELGFLQTGTFLNRAERQKNYPLIVEKKGFRIAFLNATFIGTNYLPTWPPTVVNRLDTAEILRDLAKTRLLEVDFVVAVVHWGLEHQLEESEAQRFQADFLAKNGVGAIIGMHPHVAQPVRDLTFFDEKGAKTQAVVAFSLGNFVSNHHLPNTDGGLIFHLELVREKAGEKARISRHCWQPIFRLMQEKADGSKAFFVLPIDEIEKNAAAFQPILDEKNRRVALDFAEKLRERLGKEGEW